MKKYVPSVSPWLNIVKCRRGDYCVRILRNSVDRIYIFNLKFVITSLKMKIFVIYINFLKMFDEQLLKDLFHLQYLNI